MKTTLRFGIVTSTVTLILMLGSVSSAQIMDLPNPFDDSPAGNRTAVVPAATPSPSPTPGRVTVIIPAATPRPTPKPTPQSVVVPSPNDSLSGYYDDIVTISNITRKTGGAWYSIDMTEGGTLSSIVLRTEDARLKIHEMSFLMKNGVRMPVATYGGNGEIVAINDITGAHDLENFRNIVSIQLRLESYGGYASVFFRASSTEKFAFRLREDQDDFGDTGNSNGTVAACARGLQINSQLEALNETMNTWLIRSSYARTGSKESRQANTQAQAASQKMISLVTGQSILQGTSDEIIELAGNAGVKATYAPTGSLAQKTYLHISNTAYAALPTSIDLAMKCSPWDVTRLLNEGSAYIVKAVYSPSGSYQYNAFYNSAKKIYAVLPVRYAQEARKKGFLEVEAEMNEALTRARYAPTGGLQATAFNKVANQAASMAEASFRTQVRGMSRAERNGYANSYQVKVNYSATGSMENRHYATMRRIALGR